ncbi:MAG: hypothetical protein AAFY31_10980 [Pseudomonadota bacterium]
MDEGGSNAGVTPEDVAEILENVGALMEGFRKSDLALQNALSSLTPLSGAAPNLFELQHVDLITQSHADLGRLLPVLAKALSGQRISRADLHRTLTLRSLQDSLIDSKAEAASGFEPGELSLF